MLNISLTVFMTTLILGFLISLANDNVFVVYGAWLEGSFGLGVACTAAGAPSSSSGSELPAPDGRLRAGGRHQNTIALCGEP